MEGGPGELRGRDSRKLHTRIFLQNKTIKRHEVTLGNTENQSLGEV